MHLFWKIRSLAVLGVIIFGLTSFSSAPAVDVAASQSEEDRLKNAMAALEKALSGSEQLKINFAETALRDELKKPRGSDIRISPVIEGSARTLLNKIINPLMSHACPAGQPIPDSNMNIAGIRAYIDNNKRALKSPDDVICCLPEGYRRNYVIVHDSIAGQNSDLHGPRVLLFNDLANRGKPGLMGNPLDCVISINGGQEHLKNHSNVEALCNSKQNYELELSDANFENGHVEHGGKNPATCVVCHGKDGKVDIGGVHPNFDPFTAWSRNVGGTAMCTSEEKELASAISQTAKSAIERNPRYRCLAPLPDGERTFQVPLSGILTSDSNQNLDRALADYNDRRLYRILKTTALFDAYKYAIAGALLKCDLGADGFQGWLPDEVLKSHDSKTYLRQEFSHSTNLIETARIHLNNQVSQNNKISAAQKIAAKKVLSGEAVPYEFSENLMACSTKDAIQDRLHEMSAKLTKSDLLNRFRVEGEVNAFRGGSVFNPDLRFLIEGRGIEMATWSTEPLAGEYKRSPEFLLHHIFDNELLNSPLKQIGRVLEESGFPLYPDHPVIIPAQLTPDQFFEGQKTAVNSSCLKLKALSIKAFEITPKTELSPSQRRTLRR
jgi:hypothetical protein